MDPNNLLQPLRGSGRRPSGWDDELFTKKTDDESLASRTSGITMNCGFLILPRYHKKTSARWLLEGFLKFEIDRSIESHRCLEKPEIQILSTTGSHLVVSPVRQLEIRSSESIIWRWR